MILTLLLVPQPSVMQATWDGYIPDMQLAHSIAQGSLHISTMGTNIGWRAYPPKYLLLVNWGWRGGRKVLRRQDNCLGQGICPHLKVSSSRLYLLHHFHDDGSRTSQDEVAHCPVVCMEDVQPIHRNHKLADLKEMGGERGKDALSVGQRQHILLQGPNTKCSRKHFKTHRQCGMNHVSKTSAVILNPKHFWPF